MIKIIISLMLVFSLGIVSAQVTNEEISEAGMTPDNVFYGLDLFFEQIEEAINPESKFKHLRERIMETKVMIHQNKIQEAERARKEFDKISLKIQNQTRIKEQKEFMNNLGNQISQIASVKGKLTENQKQEIQDLIFQHRERIRNEYKGIEVQINNGD